MATEQRNLRLLKAPFDGVVADVFFDEGESVQANQPVLRLVSDDRCYLVLNVPNEALVGRAAGDPARIKAETNPPVEKEGVLDFISPLVDAASGLRKMKIVFENESPRIEPGISGLWLVE
jgi:multidrug resistance efflux pump